MPITPRAVAHLRAAGHDAVHASAAELSGAPDTALIEAARRDGRVIVTADLDFPRLLAVARADGPGIILFRGGSYTDQEMLSLLDRVLARAQILDLDRSITVVDRARMRRRALPVTD